MQNYYLPLLPNKSYHLFNRAVGDEKMFLSNENYIYFLRKMKHHILLVCDVYTYSLMPNHFHLLVKIKDENSLIDFFQKKKNRAPNLISGELNELVMQQFSNWFNGYTKAFNKMYERKGSLFMDFMKRSLVENDADFSTFIFYIHKNAVHHGLTNNIGEWKMDGFKSILSNKPTLLLREEVIEFFGSKERFIKFHEQPVLHKINWLE